MEKSKENSKTNTKQNTLKTILVPIIILVLIVGIGAAVNGIYDKVVGNSDDAAAAEAERVEALKEAYVKYSNKIDNIKIGMSYHEVCDIMEFEGETTMGNKELITGIYTWEYATNEYLTLSFENGKLVEILNK